MDTKKSKKYNLVGASQAIVSVKNNALNAARTDFSVLILGERGTGKELFARFIHNSSSRVDKPFVAVNCAAIPESMMDSELFGIEDRVATGVKAHEGVFEAADGGTVFLDEIADMPFAAQAKILRVLQEREVTRVGGRRSIPVDVRIIAATNKIEEIHDEGKFRADLLDRLNEAPITLPPLRDRKGDVTALLKYFLGKYGYGGQITRTAWRLLEDHSWPGNVRELENLAKRIVMFASEKSRLSSKDLLTIHPELCCGKNCQAHARKGAPLAAGKRNTHQEILDYLSQNGTAGRDCICSTLGFSPTTFKRRMGELCADGKVIATGEGRAKKYRITGPDDFVEEVTENQGLSVFDSRCSILAKYLNSNGWITRGEYEKLTSVSTATACRDLRAMVESGFVNKKGSGRTSIYFLKTCGKEVADDSVENR